MRDIPTYSSTSTYTSSTKSTTLINPNFFVSCFSRFSCVSYASTAYIAFFISFVSFISFVFFALFVFLTIALIQIETAYAGKEEFREYLNHAKTLKDSAAKSVSGFAPEKVFDNYSANPSPAKYYSEDSASASQTLKSDSISSLTINKEGQAIAENSKTRPQFKINQESEEIKGSKKIQTLASKSIRGTIEGFLSGEETQINTKGTKYVIKTCNEEIRPLKRIYNKTPIVTTTLTNMAQPNCKSVVVAQTYRGGCPSGYSQIVYSDMIRFEDWDDISICVKAVGDEEGSECYAGYLVYGISHANRLVQSTWQAAVPKKVHGRLKFSNVYRGHMAVTIVNETTGQTLYSGTKFANGQVVELPFSDTKDQVFRFSEPQLSGGFGFFFKSFAGIGVMLLVFDHIYKEKTATVAWNEVAQDV